MNFLFVNPKYTTRGEPYEFSLGMAYVSSYLKKGGFNVFCLNTCHCDDTIEEQLFRYINDKHIDVVCTGGMSLYYAHINAILEASKRVKPDIITVVGGPIVTSDPKLVLENMAIDYGIIGEGEETMADLADALCNNKDVRNIDGIAYIRNGELFITDSRSPISDLDALPIPDYEGFGYGYLVNLSAPTSHQIYYTILDEVRPAKIISSRSCPFNCTFCYHPLGKKYRQRSLDNVFEEIDYLVNKYDINLLILMDELFSIDRERMYEFAGRIKKYNIKWIPQLRVSDVDENIINILKDSGAYMISYGIENLSMKILNSMNKKITKYQIEHALELTRKGKVAIQGNILFGDPEETEETINESINWWLNHPEYGLNLCMIVTLPDAPIYRYAIENGLIKNKLQYMKDGFPIINLTKLTGIKFKELCDNVARYPQNEKYITVGKIIHSEKVYQDNNKKSAYSIIIECPECLTQSKYNNMKQESFNKYLLIICRDCHRRLYVRTKDCFPLNYTIINIIIYNAIRMARVIVCNNTAIRSIYNKIGYKCNSLLRSYLFR